MKKINKFLLIINLLLLSLCISSPVYGAAFETLSESDEYEEVISLTDEILYFAKGSYPDICEDITSENIHFDKALKRYGDSELFEKQTLSRDEMTQKLSNAPYAWIIPIYMENETLSITLSIFHGFREEILHLLTQEQIDQYKPLKEKWIINHLSLLEHREYYFEQTQALISQYFSPEDDVKAALIIGVYGLSGTSLILNTGGNQTYVSAIDSLQTTGQSGSPSMFSYTQQPFYDFSDIQKSLAALPKPDPDVQGGAEIIDFKKLNSATPTIFVVPQHKESVMLLLILGLSSVFICAILKRHNFLSAK